jgi:flagellar protein FliO/FliZ
MMKVMKSYLLLPSIFFCCLLAPPSSASAEEQHPSPQENPTQPHESEFGHLFDQHLPDNLKDQTDHETDTFQSKFLNMIFVLGLLIGFMILASWALKRMMKTRVGTLNTAGDIKIIETRYLSPRATLYVVEIHQKTFLIAESPTTVTFLSELPK